ncbi:MAG: hypothetical protein HN534_04725 [Euryarchaeota archaeon]|nr:hypothetical protein [Euryarchaeota archaeon]MBT3654214.1 hypothetical protein [Euryarchaeota archaeon]MBT3757130.1 hypothetical protein [Euryarchaeota archaeon]MBT4050298.1 hypothetical protein [Euryarchaeota archaeon]MBT4346354.1 hypothetical protein [Euryarchaeota archaeon]
MDFAELLIWFAAIGTIAIISYMIGKNMLTRWRLGYRLDNLDEDLRGDTSLKIEVITSAPQGSEISTSVPAILLDESE